MSSPKHIFSNSGPIAKKLPHFETRESQLQMAEAVTDIIQSGGVLLAEAGTGTGKTLAYLVAAISQDERIIISTGTKNLQEQIYFKDLDFLKSMFDLPGPTAILKGQDNYLCPKRLHDFVASPASLAFPSSDVAALVAWAETTQTGDRMELNQFSDDSLLWQQVCSTKETRIGAKCPFAAECFVGKARMEAARAQIVVVNHHLYFADIATRLNGGALLPSHQTVIFDEAHLIEDIATEFFSTTVSSRQIHRSLDDVLKTTRVAKLANDPAELKRPNMVSHCKSCVDNFFLFLKGETMGRRILSHQDVTPNTIDAYHKLDSALESIELSLKQIENMDANIDHQCQRIATLRTNLGTILDETHHGNVKWVECRSRSVLIGSSPIDISNQFNQGVLLSVPSVVLTSATLSAGGNFEYLKSRLGIDFEVEELSVLAPFDYTKQAALYLPAPMPMPKEDNFIEAALDQIRQLIDLTCGGALILTTSKKNMMAFQEGLMDYGPGDLLVQGSAPKSQLVNQFVRHKQNLLLATASFWQGIDIPGEALRLVIIDKLPFASPTDPIVSARIDYLKEQGEHPFSKYQIPQAALTLKQGFGRLIRSKNDFGIVAILDPRLQTARYAHFFRNSLPKCPTQNNIEGLINWWNQNSPYLQ